MNSPDTTPANAFESEPRNTDPKTVLVGMLASAQSAIVPAIAILFAGGPFGALIAIPVAAAIVLIGALFSYIGWKRLTYRIGETDIRVESGVLSRAARSVPYERIQDVSLEQKLLPRLFGLVSVKFETGAGGADDIALSFLTEDTGEELRQLVRARRDGQAEEVQAASGQSDIPVESEEPAEPLFSMGPRRLFTFGLFEFSLAVFAVLGGLFQYADSFIDFDDWDSDVAQAWLEERGMQVSTLDTGAQALGVIGGIVALLVIGSLTGMIRVFTRDWGFLLERTARGFRRRRGLFTRTDVVMPVHRVQGVKLATGFLRYRFGWHSLSFVSLAQDMGASNHVVAPFAKLDEIAPIAEAAGYSLPSEQADWHRATSQYLFDHALFDALGYFAIALGVGTATAFFAPEWQSAAVGAVLIIAGLSVMANVLAWKFQRHALDLAQIMGTRGVLAPKTQIANRLKLHSVEISQGPIARLRGYATLHLGQAGGNFSIRGVALERAQEVRREVLKTIAATDFSRLEQA